MSSPDVPTETTVELPTGKIRLLRGGSGSPLVALHHDVGSFGWTAFHEALANRFSVYAPDLPGFGQSDRPEWARHPRDLAILLLQMIHDQALQQVTLAGLGFGGWIAAEMATMDQGRLRGLVLVGPMGIRPPRGEILDQMMTSHIDYVKVGFRDEAKFERAFGAEPSPEQVLLWDLSREMTARIAWKPYMFSHQLPQLLRGVRTPSLIVWGREDAVVPLSCAEAFEAALPNGRLVVMEDAGHFVDMEQPAALARLIVEHSGEE
jgi:pimeloyl-ACP methyl ester carboxylesterase